jgi:hypothetical protein
MQYVLTVYTDEAAIASASPDEIKEHLGAFAAFIKDITDRGVLVTGVPLQPTPSATTVRVRAGETLVTDGPFAETKEQLASFFLVECTDLDEALELAARVPSAALGAVEIRPVWEEVHDRVRST